MDNTLWVSHSNLISSTWPIAIILQHSIQTRTRSCRYSSHYSRRHSTQNNLLWIRRLLLVSRLHHTQTHQDHCLSNWYLVFVRVQNHKRLNHSALICLLLTLLSITLEERLFALNLDLHSMSLICLLFFYETKLNSTYENSISMSLLASS